MNIAVSGRPRSGTTVFRQLLGSSRESVDVGEIFHYFTSLKYNFWRYLHEQINKDISHCHPSTWGSVWNSYLSEISREHNVQTVVFDIKTQYFHYVINCDGSGIRSFCLDGNTKLILVERENIARQIISGMIANGTNDWAQPADNAPDWMRERFDHARGVAPAPAPRERIFITPQDLHTAIMNTEMDNIRIEKLLEGHIYAKLKYEEMFDDFGNFKNEIIDCASQLTGIEKSKFNSKPFLKKQGPKSIFDDIKNDQEVRSFFEATKYAWMFE